MSIDYSHWLIEAASGAPRETAILAGDSSFTYADVEARVGRLARALHAAGVGPGDRVGLCLGNRLEWVTAFFALARLRAAAVMMSTSWQEHEVSHGLELTRPVAVIVDHTKTPTFDAVGSPGLALVVRSEEGVAGWRRLEELDLGAPLPSDVVNLDATDMELALPFSSGTTGAPKAVRHTHHSLDQATRQWRHVLDIGPTDRLQALTPLSHILGIVNIGATFAGRARIRLFERFSPSTMVQSFETDRITIGMAVAPIASALASMPDLERFDLSSLRYLNWSATPVNAEVARRVTERTGVPWLAAYGTTEVPILTANPVRDPLRARLDSVGLPAPDVEIEAVDTVSLAVLPRNETGELVVRSPAAMLGYLPGGASAPFLEGGWYRTGDIGHVEPEGWVVVTDRLKELIKVAGHQVSPVELETVLSACPHVADCAVYGVPDDRRGEVPVAAVVPVPGWQPDPDAVIDWLAPRLATYKRLSQVHFVAAIPRTPSGKIQRRKVAGQSR